MARGRSGGSRSGGGRAGGSRSSSRSSFSGSRSSSRSFSSGRSSLGSGGSRSSNWSRSGSSGSFSSSHTRPISNRPTASRSAVSRPSGSFTSHRPDMGRPTVMRHKPGVPTGSYMHRRPIGGSLFGGGNIFIGGNIFGGGNFSGNTTGESTNTSTSDSYDTTQNGPQTVVQDTTGSENTMYTSNGEAPTVQKSEKRRQGCFTTLLTIGFWCLLIYLLFMLIKGPSSDYTDSFTKSTIKREKLNVRLSEEAGYFTDECGWIDNRTKMEKGLKEFYDSTGIMPYVYILDNVGGDYDPSTEKLEQFAEQTYEALFSDEGHVLLVFWDHSDAYEYVLWLGEDAAEFMDAEACDILFDYLDYYYYENVSDEEFFAYAFAEAGERMMHVEMTSGQYTLIIISIAAAVIIVYIIYRKRKARQEKEAERRKRAEEILNAPLEKFGDNGDMIDALEKKYEKEI